jgi:hypothetical protein
MNCPAPRQRILVHTRGIAMRHVSVLVRLAHAPASRAGSRTRR